jgi:CheY-like chemotaxis protein
MTDLFMPVMDGFEVLRRLRANPATRMLPVMVVSSGDVEAKLRALALGADVFLGKPVPFAELIATVRRLLVRG